MKRMWQWRVGHLRTEIANIGDLPRFAPKGKDLLPAFASLIMVEITMAA
jgi:hypothetical protein